MKNEEIIKLKPDESIESNKEFGHFLILHNDDIHTFDYVIESLVEICKHNIEQAEQCTYITHFKGKCEVKTGTIEELKPYKYGLIDKGLSATIE
ncbi:MAG: ATP-dependent Clp protease adaptor ClpS [Bacteroidales bacterium]|nr:ATP-dependent Clp protease adaptor ClpS [Bacteroidales bacterium]